MKVIASEVFAVRRMLMHDAHPLGQSLFLFFFFFFFCWFGALGEGEEEGREDVPVSRLTADVAVSSRDRLCCSFASSAGELHQDVVSAKELVVHRVDGTQRTFLAVVLLQRRAVREGKEGVKREGEREEKGEEGWRAQ